MVKRSLIIALAALTILDIALTVIGLGLGCRELNPYVTKLGIPLWIIFRLLLLECTASIFLFGSQALSTRFQKGTLILEAGLIIINIHLGAIPISGTLNIVSRLLQ